MSLCLPPSLISAPRYSWIVTFWLLFRNLRDRSETWAGIDFSGEWWPHSYYDFEVLVFLILLGHWVATSKSKFSVTCIIIHIIFMSWMSWFWFLKSQQLLWYTFQKFSYKKQLEIWAIEIIEMNNEVDKLSFLDNSYTSESMIMLILYSNLSQKSRAEIQ